MREIVLDTETTGFEPGEGDRIVEIGAVELMNSVPTGRSYHQYVNPERTMPAGAFAVHGLGDDFLRDFPVFAQVGQAFLDFIADAPLVIHNAAFDMKFLNAELGWMGLPTLPFDRAVDTLAMARARFPGAYVSLDALCRRFGVDSSARTRHGALLDSELLAEVYLELRGGRQSSLSLASDRSRTVAGSGTWTARPRPEPLPSRLSEAERAAHADHVAELGPRAIWTRYGS